MQLARGSPRLAPRWLDCWGCAQGWARDPRVVAMMVPLSYGITLCVKTVELDGGAYAELMADNGARAAYAVDCHDADVQEDGERELHEERDGDGRAGDRAAALHGGRRAARRAAAAGAMAAAAEAVDAAAAATPGLLR